MIAKDGIGVRVAVFVAVVERDDEALGPGLDPQPQIVAEFAHMMHDAIDLSQELQNLQRFTVNFADEPDIVFFADLPGVR